MWVPRVRVARTIARESFALELCAGMSLPMVIADTPLDVVIEEMLKGKVEV